MEDRLMILSGIHFGIAKSSDLRWITKDHGHMEIRGLDYDDVRYESIPVRTIIQVSPTEICSMIPQCHDTSILGKTIMQQNHGTTCLFIINGETYVHLATPHNWPMRWIHWKCHPQIHLQSQKQIPFYQQIISYPNSMICSQVTEVIQVKRLFDIHGNLVDSIATSRWNNLNQLTGTNPSPPLCLMEWIQHLITQIQSQLFWRPNSTTLTLLDSCQIKS
jgi:hypothetical protein